MNDIITIDNISIHQDRHGRYSLNDLHKAAVAAGVTKDIRPNEWLSLQTTKELAEILITENRGIKPIMALTGRYGGTYVCRELVYAYASWISPAFNLKVIRTFDAVITGKLDWKQARQAPPQLFSGLSANYRYGCGIKKPEFRLFRARQQFLSGVANA